MQKAIVGLALILVTAGTAGAVTIWATDNLGTANAGTIGDRIIHFDSANPATPVVVGATGIASTLMGGLDFANGTLYAYGQTGSVGLYTINQTTGAATFVGSGGLVSGDSLTDISWDPTTGQMYGIGSLSTPNLYTINLATGVATNLGTLTGASGTLNVGLATSPGGIRYMHDLVNDGFYRLNGLAATFLGAEGLSANYSQGATFDIPNNILYHGAFNATTFRTELWTVNTTTGAGTFVGNIGGVNGGTGLPEYETGDIAIVVPEPATLLILGALALLRRR